MSDFPVNPLVLIGVGSSFAFSGLFYHLYGEKKKELAKLKVSVPIHNPFNAVLVFMMIVLTILLHSRQYPFSNLINIWPEY